MDTLQRGQKPIIRLRMRASEMTPVVAGSEGQTGLKDDKKRASELRRATYYLRPEQIRALKLYAVENERPLSALVRQAVDQFLASEDGRTCPV